MDKKYSGFIKKENEFYQSVTKISVPDDGKSRYEELDIALDWLASGTEKVLDFGCGAGTMLFVAGAKGVKECVGIDLAEEGIGLCRKRAKLAKKGRYEFMIGSLDKLKELSSDQFDGIIVSNILDNLYPDDAKALMEEIVRVAKKKAKLFVKVNPFITAEQIKKWNIKKIEGNLYDDGLLLWNQTNGEWEKFLDEYVSERKYMDIYFPEEDQHNRMYLCLMK